MSAFPAVRIGDHAKHGVLLENRHGAGDEGTGNDFAGDGEENHRWQAAEIIGISDRQMRRSRERNEEVGYDGLFDRRCGKPSPRRVPVKTLEQVLSLYREKYFRLQGAAFSREAASRTWSESELHLGQAGVAGSRSGGAGMQNEASIANADSDGPCPAGCTIY